MAISTQLRVQQVSGSIMDLAYSGSVAVAADDRTITEIDIGGILGQFAGAIGRISGKSGVGATSFTNQAAGIFNHDTPTFFAGNDANVKMILGADNGDDAGDEWAFGIDKTSQAFTIGSDKASAGTHVAALEITPHATATSTLATFSGKMVASGGQATLLAPAATDSLVLLQADNSANAGDDWSILAASGSATLTIGNDKASAGTAVAALTLLQDATAANSLATFAGDIRLNGNDIQNSEGTTTLTLDTDEGLTIAGDLTVSGNDLDFGNGATIVNTDVSTLTITEATVVAAGNLQVNGNITGDADEAKAIFAASTTPANAITIGGGADVVSKGDLKVLAADTAGAALYLQADDADDAGDEWKFLANADQSLDIGNDIAVDGTFVSHLNIVPANPVGNSTVTVPGAMAVEGSTLTVQGLANTVAKIVMAADIGADAGDDWNITATADGASAATWQLSNDIALKNTQVVQMQYKANSTLANGLLTVEGKVKVGGNVIQDSGDNAAITFTAGTTAALVGNLRLGATGIIQNSAGEDVITIDANQKSAFSGHIISAASTNLVLSASTGQVTTIKSGNGLFFGDAYADTSQTWTGTTIKLAKNSKDWTDLVTAFGDGVSLLECIISGSSVLGDTRVKTEYAITGAAGYPKYFTVPAGWSMSGITDAQAPTKLDVFVNGQLLRSGVVYTDPGNRTLDYQVGLRAASPQEVYFNFDLLEDDVVTVISR